MRLAAVLLALAASSALAQGTPPAQAKTPEAKAPEARPGENSTLNVRCMDDCTVRVDGKGGLRKDPASWEFKDVPPGQRRVEANGGFLNRPLYSGYVDVPGGMKVTAQIDNNKRLTVTERIPLGETKEAKAPAGKPSEITVRCLKSCTLTMDGARKGASQSQLVVIRDVPPGDHTLEVKFILGSKVVRSVLDIPAGSEVFATASESGLSITNTRPLGDK